MFLQFKVIGGETKEGVYFSGVNADWYMKLPLGKKAAVVEGIAESLKNVPDATEEELRALVDGI